MVDDEAKYRRLLNVNLTMAGFVVREASTGAAAVQAVTDKAPDLVLLDLLLPDGHGLDVLQRIRQIVACPVIIVSALGATAEVVRGLDLGADDYLAKPFNVMELEARVRAVLRRGSVEMVEEPLVERGPFVLDRRTRTLSGPGGVVRLTPIEWRLMHELLVHAGTVVTHERLLSKGWGPEYIGEETYLRVYIRRLRTYIEHTPAEPWYLVTYPGVGYGLRLDEGP